MLGCAAMGCGCGKPAAAPSPADPWIPAHVVETPRYLIHASATQAQARAVGEAVAQGRADLGVVMCWTGTGVSIAANKVHGVRAALCTDAETARGARRWNDANVLAMGLRLTTTALVGELVDAFLATDVDDGEAATIATVEPG